jgi:hypothetical protein
MADYYTLLDFTLPFYEIHGQTQKMHDDCVITKRIVELVFEHQTDNVDDAITNYLNEHGTSFPADHLRRDLFEIVVRHYNKMVEDNDNEGECLSVNIRVGPPNDGVCFYTDENADPSQVVKLGRLFAEVCGLDGVWGFEYTNTCSRPRADAYGGGAVVFTRTSENWMNTYHWMTKKIDQINARRAKKAKKK